jgi:glycosyltransferase involved in cell wall biosynthesis
MKVTIGVPLYKRFDYLPGVLVSLNSQDLADLDILISDNGENGPELRGLIDAHLDRPYRFRRNESSVSIGEHFNQLLDAAQGEYFTLLSDDDEISSNFAAKLSEALDADRAIGLALPSVQVLDADGAAVERADRGDAPPARMSGEEFVRLWCETEFDFVCFVTTMVRTRDARDLGGYPRFEGGTAIDDSMVLKNTFGRQVAYVPEAEFRYRVYESSTGLALPPERLARDIREFLRFLDEDPVLRKFSEAEPEAWNRTKELATRLCWRTYRHRWRTMYRDRLDTASWIRAAFYMPPIPEYYRSVLRTMVRRGLSAGKGAVIGGSA